MMDDIKFLAPRHDYQLSTGWSRRVEVNGQQLTVGIEQGKRVRIKYKPRGDGAYGHQWWGFVRDSKTGVTFWSSLVTRSIGCSGLIERAGNAGKLPKATS